jgi:hypothetical protein
MICWCRGWLSEKWLGEKWLSEKWLSEKWLSEKWLSEKWLGEKWLSEKWLGEKWLGEKWLGEKWLSEKWLSEKWLSDVLNAMKIENVMCAFGCMMWAHCTHQGAHHDVANRIYSVRGCQDSLLSSRGGRAAADGAWVLG